MAPDLTAAQLAVWASRFEAIARKMTNALFRSARSGVINTARDVSCCIVTASGEILATAESLPIHVLCGPDLAAQAMLRLHPHLRQGDAFLHNSPYDGNSHAADHSLLVPVVDNEGVLRYTVVVKAHVADCGNAEPTSMLASAEDVYAEGALIFDCVAIQRGYKDCQDVVRICRDRIRVPDMWYGDYLAMVGSARLGERELLRLGTEIGWDNLEAFEGEWFSYSERRMKQLIGRLSPGAATVTSVHDPIPGVPGGVPVNVTVRIDTQAGRITVDLTNNVDCLPCGLNLTQATARAAALTAVFNSLTGDVPVNAGSLRCIDVLLRHGCVAGIPLHPFSCSVATTGIADRVANATHRAFAEIAAGLGMAEAGGLSPASAAVISGRDPRKGEAPFVNLLIKGLTGGGAGPEADGWLTNAHAGNAGLMFRDSTEVDELLYPIVIWEERLVADTGGAGEFRGATSARVEYGPLECELEAMWISDGCVNAALGADGGGAGAPARQFLRHRDGTLKELSGCARIRLRPGETILSFSCGGGGYGAPYGRDIGRLLHDVREGYVSKEEALATYGREVESLQAIPSLSSSLRTGGLETSTDIAWLLPVSPTGRHLH